MLMNAAYSARDIPVADSCSYNRPLADTRLVACPHCDLLQRLPEVAPGASARCPRCDKELWRHREDSLNRTLALTLTAAVLYVLANAVPMLGLTAVGHQAATTVFGGAVQLWRDGQEIVAVLILFAAVVAPALQIGSMLLITVASLRERPPAWVGALLRHIPFTRTWSMLEVMLVGVLVALTKIADYATVDPGLALFAVGGLVFLLPAIQSNFDPRVVWDKVEWAEAAARPATAGERTVEATP